MDASICDVLVSPFSTGIFAATVLGGDFFFRHDTVGREMRVLSLTKVTNEMEAANFLAFLQIGDPSWPRYWLGQEVDE